MKSTCAAAFLALVALSASAAPTNGTHEFEARSQMRPKRGASFNTASQVAPMAGTIGWAYNWNHVKDGNLPSGVEYVPMLWGTDANHISGWDDAMNAAISAGATHLLGFNEPDNGGQAAMTPQQAADAWKQHIQPYAGRVKLVSPAITNGAPPSMGTGWMDQFLAACTGCTIDAIAIHIYDSSTNIPYFQSYIPGVGHKYNKPVWVTEFAGSGSDQQRIDFINQMIPFLAAEPTVERYAYFGDIEGQLITNGQLNAVGNAYKNV